MNEEVPMTRAILARWIAGFLSDFIQSCATKGALAINLAADVVMMHPVPVGIEGGDEIDAWIRTHQRMGARAIVRALKRHRRWAEVRKVLAGNCDDIHSCLVVSKDYHTRMMRALDRAART